MRIAAFDVDLGRVHGYSADGTRICYNAPEWPWDAILSFDRILVEIAHPVSTAHSDAESYNRRKWAIGNALMIGRLTQWLEARQALDRMLVSPANWWTLGYPEECRDRIARCVREDNHDIRACRAMLVFHSTNPEKWMPLWKYHAALSDKPEPKKKRKAKAQ
jgi:hypothetical protein